MPGYHLPVKYSQTASGIVGGLSIMIALLPQIIVNYKNKKAPFSNITLYLFIFGGFLSCYATIPILPAPTSALTLLSIALASNIISTSERIILLVQNFIYAEKKNPEKDQINIEGVIEKFKDFIGKLSNSKSDESKKFQEIQDFYKVIDEKIFNIKGKIEKEIKELKGQKTKYFKNKNYTLVNEIKANIKDLESKLGALEGAKVEFNKFIENIKNLPSQFNKIAESFGNIGSELDCENIELLRMRIRTCLQSNYQ
jgi:hypothetical protein